ncbi:MAG: Porphobilinogen deaminase [Pelotomaculum sp. PtaB.Bin013]|uniref:Porphobilinogen deaminase n=1 Tax=Pelotomaculum isophthalicicum JI TaxID=947010 RepID=A0A9X4JVC2_9FIRM|nr:hydroxymethylbilane synthase [Pelotomaculum isophthalicicum]MDF9408051.1 hydroxymethylbilane synthase [Pelotomaculum isophthalicicum JI]OPX88248.1 MAG: Porphobilinogen deaminase [Pelotomaculum sp. PtaB.Bin013]
MSKEIVIGTRESRLALWQANWVKDCLQKLAPAYSFRIKGIKTLGDKNLDTALAKIGDKGLFTKELELALLRGKIDLAVHSMKDMPTILPEGLVIGAVCRRENPGDVLISRKGNKLEDLPPGAIIGTSSLRRRAQLCHYRNDFKIINLRGNVDTRLGKLESEMMDAVVLSFAGVHRLGLGDRITQLIPLEVCLPAVGQGSIGVEIRAGDEEMQNLTGKIDHHESRLAVTAERALLRKLEGGCQIPVGALGTVDNGRLLLEGVVASLDGSKLVRSSWSGSAEDAASIGVQLAEKLAQMGAGELLRSMRQENCHNV